LLFVDEDPTHFVWDLIERAITKEAIHNTNNYVVTSKKNNNIKYLFEQAKELFIAAENASDIVAPLYQFYSFSMLSKILILIKTKSKDIESLQQSHGLTIIVNDRKNPTLENIKVKIGTTGTFIELLNINSSCKYLYEKEIDLINLINRVVDCSTLSNTTKVIPICGYRDLENDNIEFLNQGKNKKILIHLNMKSKVSIHELAIEYPNIGLDKLIKKTELSSLDMEGIGFWYYYNDHEIKDLKIQNGIHDDNFLISPIVFDNNKYWYEQYEILYILSFIASNLVRYYPDTWKIINGNSEIFWVFRYILKLTNRIYPNYIIDKIENQIHTIYPPGILKYTI